MVTKILNILFKEQEHSSYNRVKMYIGNDLQKNEVEISQLSLFCINCREDVSQYWRTPNFV